MAPDVSRVCPAVCTTLVALGLAAVVYGTASLTGGWLGHAQVVADERRDDGYVRPALGR